MDNLECKKCNLKIYEGEFHQLQPAIQRQKNIKCAFGIHKYKFLVRLYENAEPLSVAIFKVCERCEKGIVGPIAYEHVYSVTKRKTHLKAVPATNPA